MKAQMFNDQRWIKETDPEKLKTYFSNVLNISSFNIVSILEKYFDPHGYTCLFLLSESHLAIHTFPEEKKTYIELSSCVKKPFDEYIHLLSIIDTDTKIIEVSNVENG